MVESYVENDTHGLNPVAVDDDPSSISYVDYTCNICGKRVLRLERHLHRSMKQYVPPRTNSGRYSK